jgi:hypothetical protein
MPSRRNFPSRIQARRQQALERAVKFKGVAASEPMAEPYPLSETVAAKPSPAAELSDVDLSGTRLGGADLGGALSLTQHGNRRDRGGTVKLTGSLYERGSWRDNFRIGLPPEIVAAKRADSSHAGFNITRQRMPDASSPPLLSDFGLSQSAVERLPKLIFEPSNKRFFVVGAIVGIIIFCFIFKNSPTFSQFVGFSFLFAPLFFRRLYIFPTIGTKNLL